jgi:hypothetical protein
MAHPVVRNDEAVGSIPTSSTKTPVKSAYPGTTDANKIIG